MDIKAILTENGVDAEAIAKLSKAIEAAVGNEFVEKQRYKDKLSEIETLKTSLKTAEDNATTADTYKQKWEDEVTAHATTKTDYATKATAAAKRAAARQALKALGAHDEDLDTFLLDKVDYDKVELDGDKVKDPKAFESYKEQYKRYFGDTVTVGAGVATPPRGDGGNAYATQYAEARKAGNNADAIAIKLQAAQEGIIIN